MRRQRDSFAAHPFKKLRAEMVRDLGLELRRTGGLPRRLARRSSIEPFIVMDVMREANAHEAEGRDIIHMEVGQPGTPAPRAARERARQALETERARLYGCPGASGFARAHRPPLSGALWSQRCARARRRHDGLVRRIRAGLPRRARSRAKRCCCRRPAIPATGRSSARLAQSLSCIETGAASRWMPSPGDLDRHRRRGRRPVGRKPEQSDRAPW